MNSFVGDDNRIFLVSKDNRSCADGVGLVVEVELVLGFGRSAVDAKLALDRIERARVLVALRGADVHLVKAAARVKLDRQAGDRRRHVEPIALRLRPELDRDVVGRIEDDRAGRHHVESGDAVAHIGAHIGVVVA